MGENAKISLFRFMGVITAAGTARLYHILPENAMGEDALFCSFTLCGDHVLRSKMLSLLANVGDKGSRTLRCEFAANSLWTPQAFEKTCAKL